MKFKETLEEFINQIDTPNNFDQHTYDEGIRVGAKWQSEHIPIHILDVDNINAHIDDGTVIIEKNNKSIITYSEEEMVNLLYKRDLYLLNRDESKELELPNDWINQFKL
jgi:hypothetical protein